MARNYADETPFHLAAREGKLNILQLFTEHFHFDIDHDSMDGWAAIHFASLNGFLSGIELIHRKGGSLTIPDKLKRTPLHWACKFN
mmetsp:Transcript_24967/g.24432  ORF Transcript_24967/g.24432 Transcript_24967/m.24432 type:complete len:86 (+) Transcript_24967:847-1104(+)